LTLFKFWLVSNYTTEESPADISPPLDASVIDQLQLVGVRTAVYDRSSVWHSLDDSFGVFIDGKVFSQDLAKFRNGLDAYWNDTGAGLHVEILIPKMYFKTDSYVTAFLRYSTLSPLIQCDHLNISSTKRVLNLTIDIYLFIKYGLHMSAAVFDHTGWSKNGYPVLFGDNFGNSALIFTILSLL